MATQGVPYPNKLRARIEASGYSFKEVSYKTGIPKSTLYDWASGNRPIPHSEREILASLLGCEVRDLQPLDTSHMLQLAQECGLPSLGEEMNRKRRELLQLLGFAGSWLLFPLPDVDWDRLQGAVARPSRLDTALLESLAAINSHCWTIFMTAPSKAVVFDGVHGQLKMYLRFFQEPQEEHIRQRLCALASEMGQLVGEVFFDLHDATTAQTCYVFAAQAAKDAGAYDMWASACIRHAYLPLFDERYEEALPLLQQAEVLAQRGDSSLPTRYWAAATYAEAASGVEQANACHQALERAHGVENLQGSSPAWVRFDGTRLPALQGACSVRLKNPRAAEAPLLEALKSLPSSAKFGRRTGMILSDLAQAALQRRNIDQACTYTEQVIDILSYNSSGFLRDHVQKMRQQLQPFAKTRAVQRLEQRVASLT